MSAGIQGLAYALTWFAFVALAPIALLSTGIYALLSHALRAKAAEEQAAPHVP